MRVPAWLTEARSTCHIARKPTQLSDSLSHVMRLSESEIRLTETEFRVTETEIPAH